MPRPWEKARLFDHPSELWQYHAVQTVSKVGMHFLPPGLSTVAIHQSAVTQYALIHPLLVSSHGYDYQLTGNTLLPVSELQRVLHHASSPTQAVALLRGLYLDHGYFLVAIRATFLTKNKLALQVIEGQVTNIHGQKLLQGFFSNLKFRPNLRRKNLVYRSILANEFSNRNGKNLQIGFSPSSNPGGSVLHLTQTAIPGFSPISGNVYFGNYGSRYSSRYLVGGSVTYLPGMGIMLSASGSEGLPSLTEASKGSAFSAAQFGVSSVTPWGIYGLSAQWTHYRIGDIAYPLNPTGNVFVWSATGTQLLYADAHLRWSLTEGFNRVQNDVRVYKSLIPGGYPLTTQRYNYISLSTAGNYSYSAAGLPGSVGFTFTYNQGVSKSHGTLSDATGSPTANFHYFVTGFNVNQAFPLGMRASFSATGQGSFDTLPQQQQWVLGGFDNLSAWYPGILSGDNGYSARFQLTGPSWTFHRYSVNLRIFAEAGGAQFVYAPQGPNWQSLSDIGGGITVTTPWGTQISAISALPIGWNHVSSEVRKVDRTDVFFVLSQNF